jgi:hypothetical protein
MNRSVSHKLDIALLLVLLFAASAFQVVAQTDQKVENAVATREESNLQKPTVTAPALTDLNGIAIGMTDDEVREKLGKPASSDATGMLFILDNGETLQIGLGQDKKVRMAAAIYSGKDSNAPDVKTVLGAGAELQSESDGKIYKRVRYPSAGYWVAYSRLNLANGPMTTITIQKMDVPK